MTPIAIEGATVGYGGRAVLEDVTLTVRPGEIVALVGRSGAGKSTLLRLLYERAGPAAALTPQDYGLVQSLSVFHNIYMGRLDRRGWLANLRALLAPARADVAAVRKVAARLGLEEKLFQPAGELSGGQKQRTAVGRALYREAEIVLADEPVSAVDEHQSRDVLAALLEGYDTAVLALHDRALAIAFADRIVGLKDGRIALDRPSAGLAPADLDEVYGG
ncbi:MAG: ATP-binding cassette domain-containing protein [Alphaproteobacteria bacterium]